MNAFVSQLPRDVLCAAAALMITVTAAAGFVDSTDRSAGMHAQGQVAAAQPHGWFGQPQPAVLVD
jgi:hypothetical protein